jgi:hypothetical protein
MNSDTASVMSTDTTTTAAMTAAKKKDWLQRWIHKISQTVQTDENKKMLQVFIVDPLISYMMDRIFPYIVIMCVLFVLLTGMIALTMVIVFTRLPVALNGGIGAPV